MLYKNKYHKVILTIILSLYSSCHLSTALATQAGGTPEATTSIGSTGEVKAPSLKLKLDELSTRALRNIETLVYLDKIYANTHNYGLRTPKDVSYLEGIQESVQILLKGHYLNELQCGGLDTLIKELENVNGKISIDLDNDKVLALPKAKEVSDLVTEIFKLRNNLSEETNNIIEKMAKAVNGLDDNDEDLIKERDKLKDHVKGLKAEIEKLKAKDPKKSDPKIQAEIKQDEEELQKDEQELKKTQKIIDQQNRPEVIEVQEKLQIAQAPIEAQTYAVQNIAAIQSSIMSNITDTRMNINQYDIRTSEDENKPVAAGSQTVDPYITPKSWDIWASGHMGNIKQDAADAISANSNTDFYGLSIGIDKIFANNSVFGLALSYGKSNTEYKSQRSTGAPAKEKWESNYYQVDAYVHHNFTDSLFVQLIGGIGTYGDGTTIGNMFDFSSQQSTFGYHGNATIGYSIFSGEDSNFAITPKLGVAYYHLNIPDSILSKTDSSTFTTLGRFDGIAGLNIKILNLNSNSDSNVKIIPEITAAFKLRLGDDNIEGAYADNLKLPVVKSTDSNDLSANALAAPEQLFTLGGALTVVTNNNFSISINGSVDFATQYLAMVGGISIKLSF